MLEFDTTALLASLTKAHKDATKRLEQMVRGFAYEFSLRAIENTPLGDSEKFARYYKARTALPQVEGIARGNWQFSTDPSFTLQLNAGQFSNEVALDTVEYTSQAYVLGATFYIGNSAPYIDDLESNYSSQTNGNGIMQPTLNDITGAYSVDFQRHYAK